MAVKLPSVETVFGEAVEIASESERAAYVERACAGNAVLRRQVETLLGAHFRAGGFLESPVFDPLRTMAAPGTPRPPEGPGAVIGPYTLREAIGEGGMGTVYMAEQTRPVRRKVALKVIKAGMDTKQVIARFDAERQALALMDHPNIAKVLDAGATESGRPYFVMELVQGVPITNYCDQARLSVDDRLDLFVLVCRAVQHAHQKGIIHRDIKPSNVMVTVVDGAPVPKVIDFGVAKATETPLTEGTQLTGVHQFVGTPLYMSPEQADLAGVDVDTRSDVYSLGVLLYELLTGTTPIEQGSLRSAPFDEMRRMIREVEPPRPSMRLSTLGDTLMTVSARRLSDPRQLNRTVRGDLDWIVMKALEKDRNRRYETANGLAAEVMRYLTDQPVEACPPSARYRFSKYACRHRTALTAAGLVVLSLLVGTVVSAWQAAEARKARRATAAALVEIQTRADETQQVLDYLVKDLIGAVNAGDARGRPLTVTEMLDKANEAVGRRFTGRPLLEASFRMVLAETHGSLGSVANDETARKHAARAWEIRHRLLGAEHPDTLVSRALLAGLISSGGWRSTENDAEAEPIAREVLLARRRVLGPAHPDTIDSASLLSMILSRQGRFDEALPLAEQAAAMADAHLGPDHRVAIHARRTLGVVLCRVGRIDASVALLRATAKSCERLYGPLDSETLSILHDLGKALLSDGRLEEARAQIDANVACFVRVYGFCHIQTSGPLGDLDELLRRQSDHIALRDMYQQQARDLLAAPLEPDEFLRHRRAVRLASAGLRLATLPPSIPVDGPLALRAVQEATVLSDRWSGAWSFLGAVHYRLGHLDLADQAIRSALERKHDPQEHPFDPLMLSLIYARRGDRERAMAEFEGYLKLKRDNIWLESRNPLEAEARSLLGLPPAGQAAR